MNSTENENGKTLPAFDINAYRSKNQDLKELQDEKLAKHFRLYGYKERRLYAYTKTTVDRLSMQYLRGNGFEIGAGDNPVPLYGESVCSYADISEQTVFGSTGDNTILYDINHPIPLLNKFDFVVASHVLEHIDSLAKGLTSIGNLLKKDGIAYLILPNRESDADHYWMPKFGRIHHIIEIFLPGAFRRRHEQDFCRGMTHVNSKKSWGPILQKFSEEAKQEIRRARLSPENRYIYHRHSYDFSGWISILLFLTKIITPQLTLINATIGEERSDCHFIFKRGPKIRG